MRIITSTLAVLLVSITFSFAANSFEGRWLTLHETTGKATSKVEIYRDATGKYHGRIVELFGHSNETKCTKCRGAKKDTKIVGMNIIENMTLDGNELSGGTILDPNNGNIYECKIWFDSTNANRLSVRGYAGIFYKTFTWTRL